MSGDDLSMDSLSLRNTPSSTITSLTAAPTNTNTTSMSPEAIALQAQITPSIEVQEENKAEEKSTKAPNPEFVRDINKAMRVIQHTETAIGVATQTADTEEQLNSLSQLLTMLNMLKTYICIVPIVASSQCGLCVPGHDHDHEHDDDDNNPDVALSICYTIGLQWHTNQYDLVSLGIESYKAAAILNSISRLVWEGKLQLSDYFDTEMKSGREFNSEICNVPIRFRRVTQYPLRDTIIGLSNRIAETLEKSPISYVQVITPDAHGRWPGDTVVNSAPSTSTSVTTSTAPHMQDIQPFL